MTLKSKKKLLKLYITVYLVNNTIENENPDVIIHCAAMTNVDLCEDEKELAYKINGDGTGLLAKAADKINAKYLIVIGENELQNQKANIKNLKTGEEKEINLLPEEILSVIK